MAELKWEPSVDAAHVGVTANEGVVTLTGHVDSFARKLAASAAARRVKGVKGVAEEIEVRLMSHMKRGDDEIAKAALDRLSWNVSLPLNAVKVEVEKGWVTLTGQLDWNYQRDAVAADVRWLFGVVGVSNNTTIKPRVNTANLSDDITHALHRSWFFDPDNIKVSASGGKVKLTGSVDTFHDRAVAAETAWAAPGASSVENDIVVN